MDVWLRLGITLGMGLLIGLQRERVQAGLGGVRTFPIIALVGAVSALLLDRFGVWPLVVSGLSLAAFGLVNELRGDRSGMTTEAAMLLVFLLGAWLMSGPLGPPIVIAGVLLVLLEAKPELHGWVARLEDQDVRSLAQFVLLSCVILPVLPDQTYGPFGALNQREIWLMVVLIVGVSLVGYVAQKLLKKSVGSIATGIIGGLVSSTATTASFARASKNAGTGAAALIITLASTVVYARLFAAISVAAPSFDAIRIPLGILFGVALVSCGIAWFFGRSEKTREQAPEAKPGDLRTALVFAGLYAAISLGTAAGQHYFGDAGLYVVSAISGLTDLDAITLSAARMVAGNRIDGDSAAALIVLAIMSNLTFKTGITYVLGGKALFARCALLLGINIAAAGIVFVVLISR